MPSHYLLTTCLLSRCNLAVLLYFCASCVVRRTSYVVLSHHHTVALIWHSPFHGAVPGADRWKLVGNGIGICKAVKLQRFGCVG